MLRYSKKSMTKESTITVDERIDNLEDMVCRLDADIQNLSLLINELNERLRKTQEFSIKIGHAQNRIHEYISHWPFIRVVKDHGQDLS
jgi:hypothetical protein